jgi:hypothetical protein
MELAAMGKTIVETSMILEIPAASAKSRLQAAKRKLGACNKTLAVARYLERKYKSEV